MPTIARLALTHRDTSIILLVYEYGGVTADIIRRRFFATSGARSACYTRVARLVEAGYLQSTRLPSLNGIGSGKAFLTIGPKARPLIAKALGIPQSELARNRIDTPTFAAHHFTLCDVRLSLEIAAERSRVFTLQDYTTDTELHRTPTRVKDPKTDKDVSLVPDATFTLALADGTEQTFLLEVDLATMAPKRLRVKLRCLLTSSRSPVLFVVPDYNRQAAITRWAIEEATALKRDPTLFWLTTKERITEETILDEPIWSIAGGPTIALTSLAPGSSELKPQPEPRRVLGTLRPPQFATIGV